MTIPKVPPIDELAEIFGDANACFDLLVCVGVLSRERACLCGLSLSFIESRGGFRCSSRHCRKSFSVFAGTFFSRAVLPINKIMRMAYFWLCRCSTSSVVAITGHSTDTVCAYFKYFRELVADALDEVDICIGGDGVVVELDESKFGKRKQHRGHSVEGVWVLGGVERTPERRVFLAAVPDRSMATLEGIISKHVYPGSIVYTDLWKAYSQLENHFNYEHRSVNHTLHFVDPITGVHTNTIEGTWAGIKLGIPRRNRVDAEMDEHLFEFIWRRTNSNNLWAGFLHALKDVAYE